MANILEQEIKFLPGIGAKRGELLSREMNISTFKDMLYTFPFKYIDRTRVYSISEIEPTTAYIQLRGVIINTRNEGSGKGQRLICTLKDSSGTLDLLFFQGAKWILEKLSRHRDSEWIVFGKPTFFNGRTNMVHPEIDPISDASRDIIPCTFTGIYPSTDRLRNSGISLKVFGKFQHTLLQKVLPHIKETLPEDIIKRYRLCPLDYALSNIHFPKDMNSLSYAQYRLKFEELFYLQLSLLRQKNVRMSGSSGEVYKKVGPAFNYCYSNLKFELTGAQKRVIKEIRSDITSGKGMNRLLQGDVGSGKTLVALLSALLAVDNGAQACIMAPTEVLANQHYNNFTKMMAGSNVQIALLTGSTKKKDRKIIDEGLKDGSINILVGTHAVIEDNVEFNHLGFVVIDEQHRFGVNQRAKLRFKSEIPPHILVMTATPIPRTLAMTLYGDLDVSVIDELPPGRKPIETLHISESKRYQLYNFIKKEIKAGHQAFIVYPLIKESEAMDYKNLEDGYMQIVENFPAPEYVTAVVHGKQKNEDKQYDMDLFAKGRAHILVATSVIEVGVDVPNASVMVIESAERFGLSQLHQLRGRVGRGAEKSYCILMTGYKLSKESKRRIELMCATNDGFELAEEDLKMRGPGDLEGTRQSGLAIDLKIANIYKDTLLLNSAKNAAEQVLSEDPLLTSEKNRLLREILNSMRDRSPIEIDYSIIS